MDEGIKRTFNIVNSVKGGCGKTAFSIFFARYLKGESGVGRKPLLIEMDIQGAAMQRIFLGNDEKIGIKYINDALRKQERPELFIRHLRMFDEDVTKEDLGVIFADPRVDIKEKYRAAAQSGYTSIVQYQIFKEGFRQFMKQFKKISCYSHMIFDMPPNYDGFANVAIDSLLTEDTDILKSGDARNLFFMTGLDNSHIQATVDEVAHLLLKKEKFIFDKLFIVVNNNIRIIDSEFEIKERIIELKDKIKSRSFSEDMYKKIFLAYMGPNDYYSTKCMLGSGLCNFNKDKDEKYASMFTGKFLQVYGSLYDIADVMNKNKLKEMNPAKVKKLFL